MEVDDFEDEAQRDAESYTIRRKNEAAAIKWKEENRRRKELQVRTTAAPRDTSSPRRRLFERQPKLDGTDSGSDAGDDEDDGGLGGKRKRVSDRDFTYEGREYSQTPLSQAET